MSLGKCFWVCWAWISRPLGSSVFPNQVAWAVQAFFFFFPISSLVIFPAFKLFLMK